MLLPNCRKHRERYRFVPVRVLIAQVAAITYLDKRHNTHFKLQICVSYFSFTEAASEDLMGGATAAFIEQLEMASLPQPPAPTVGQQSMLGLSQVEVVNGTQRVTWC